jgi:hypothetical protein
MKMDDWMTSFFENQGEIWLTLMGTLMTYEQIENPSDFLRRSNLNHQQPRFCQGES